MPSDANCVPEEEPKDEVRSRRREEELREQLRLVGEEAEDLREQVDSLRDALARARADYKNLKKRQSRRMEQMRDEMRGEIVGSFLPVIDDLNQVLQNTADRSDDPVRQGVEMILVKIEDILSDMDVSRIETVGEDFDPNWHEALEYVPADDRPDGTVIAELSAGFRMKDRLLRPARVRVARNASEENSTDSRDDVKEE
ncbi:MAG: nucleotide exchange factor GrpE [Bacillota bacterium]